MKRAWDLYPPDPDFVVLADPDGNAFCVVDLSRAPVGFTLDHDTRTEQMHVAQLTPHGSGCSIVIGNLPSGTPAPRSR